MVKLNRIKDAADWVDAQFGPHLSLATPLGLGKPNQLLNEIYTRVKQNPKRSLKLFTALSLQIPHPKTDLEKRLIGPFAERHFGKDYPELLYSVDLANHNPPPNIEIFEFYMQAGAALGNLNMQRHYISANYTHVPQIIYEREIKMIVCLIAKHPKDPKKYSLSCNPDLTLDVIETYRAMGSQMQILGVVHPDLPYMTEDAEVDESFFEVIVESDEVTHSLFALPREPVTEADFMIGLRASLLMPDDGTLQVGIGSLSDALVHSLILRHKDPKFYKEITDPLLEMHPRNSKFKSEFHQGTFEKGLYGTSEMVMDAFMNLRKADILKRQIFDLDDKIRRYLHGAFFLGSKDFYKWMGARWANEDHGLCMTKVSKVNDLYDAHELAIRRQRKNARFYNMCLEITLLGGIASDTLPSGQVMSGVGGQYNFVSMSHELPDARSILLFHSHHVKNGKKLSNINYGHDQATIPRHLRDIFITEYGFAFTRGLTDEAVMQANLEIADNDFQEALRLQAVKNGKLAADFRVHKNSADNTPAKVTDFMKPYRSRFKPFPFGSDFTPEEENLALGLTLLKEALPFKSKVLSLVLRGIQTSNAKFAPELNRMDLMTTSSFKEKLYQALLKGALSARAGF